MPSTFILNPSSTITTAEGTAREFLRQLKVRDITLEMIEFQLSYRCVSAKIEIIKGHFDTAAIANVRQSEIDLKTDFSRIAGQGIEWNGKIDLWGAWTILFTGYGVPATTIIYYKVLGVQHGI